MAIRKRVTFQGTNNWISEIWRKKKVDLCAHSQRIKIWRKKYSPFGCSSSVMLSSFCSTIKNLITGISNSFPLSANICNIWEIVRSCPTWMNFCSEGTQSVSLEEAILRSFEFVHVPDSEKKISTHIHENIHFFLYYCMEMRTKLISSSITFSRQFFQFLRILITRTVASDGIFQSFIFGRDSGS